MPTAKQTTEDKPKKCYKTRQKSLTPKCLVISGQTGAGKTTVAATIVPGVAEHVVNGAPKPTTLNGVIWLSADEDALVALAAKNLHPEYELDVRELAKEHKNNMGLVLREIREALPQLAEEGAKVLVWDTATTLGEFLTGWYVYGRGVPTSQAGTPNSMRGWGIVGDEYRKLYELASLLGMRQIVLCHPKASKFEEEAASGSAVAQAKATIEAAPGDNLILPAVAGQAFGRFLRGACSIEAWLRADDTRKGSKVERTRVLMPSGGDGAQGKSRYEGILAREEPADLAEIDKKILQASGK